MRQIKLRVIKPSTETQTVVFGVTIPQNVAVFYENTYFLINKTDTGIELISGTRFKDIQNVDLESYKI